MKCSIPMHGPLCRSYRGFSLHANTLCQAIERHKLKKLCEYITRPPFANESIKLRNNGDVLFKLKSPYKDGTTHLVFSQMEFLEKLAAIVPKPKAHLIRYHGAFARNSKNRAHSEFIVKEEKKNARLKPNKGWAQLLLRVFDIDMQNCHNCTFGKLKIVAAILEKKAITKILEHLNLPTEPPETLPARGPPTEFVF